MSLEPARPTPASPDDFVLPTREEAYEDALRQIAWEVGSALGEGRATVSVAAIDAPLAALVALGYVPRSPTPGRRVLTSDTPP